MKIFVVGFDAATALTAAISPAHSQPASAWPMFRLNPRHNDASAYPVLPDHISLAWSYTTVGDIESSVALGKEGTVYVGSADYVPYAFTHEGDLCGSYATTDDIGSSPAIDASDTIYLGSKDNTIYTPGATGVLSWSYSGGTTAADDIISSPLVGSARSAVLRGRCYLLGAALA